MIATADGRATLDGRSGPISDSADRALFHGLRMVVDAVMAGAGTVRTERYGPIVRDPERRRRRAELGLTERPLACIVSSSLALPADLPLLADADSRVAIITPSAGRLPQSVAAQIEYVRARGADGSLDLAAALAELHDRLHVGTLLCEGGPHLNGAMLAMGLVDELFLSVAPLLAGGDSKDTPASDAANGPASDSANEPANAPADTLAGPPSDNAARYTDPPPERIVAGPELDPPAELRLCGVLEHDSHLFLRYGVPSGPPRG